MIYAKTKRDEAEVVLIETKVFLDNITKDDEDYPKFRCIYLKALIVFEKAKYNAIEAFIKLSFIDIKNIMTTRDFKDMKTTSDFNNHWEKVNNLNFSRINPSWFYDIEYLTPIKNLYDLDVFDNLDDLENRDDLDDLDVQDLVEIEDEEKEKEDEKFEEVN